MTEQIYTKICALPGCGREFKTHKLNRIYCGPICQSTARSLQRDEYRDNYKTREYRAEQTARAMIKFQQKQKKEAEQRKIEDALRQAREEAKRRGGLLISKRRMDRG